MLTIFTIAKPFTGHTRIIQYNALHSWLALKPKPEIILFGDDEGSSEAAGFFSVRHIPNVSRNEHGTPLVDFLFFKAQEVAKYSTICYINADIILLNDFYRSIQLVKIPSYVIIGSRWDLDVIKSLDFSSGNWEIEIRERLVKEGKFHGPSGLDYFIFPRGTYKNIPPFAIGRTAWDNWLVFGARVQKTPVINATKAITIIHQNHEYLHNTTGEKGIWEGPEAKRNVQLAGGPDNAFTMDYATALLTPSELKSAITPKNIYFRLRANAVLCPRLHFLLPLFKTLEKFLKRTAIGYT
jgi:hypothetical protein